MSESLYSYTEKIDGKIVTVILKQDFCGPISTKGDTEEFERDSGEVIVEECHGLQFPEVYVPSGTKWVLKKTDDIFLALFVTQEAEKIETSMGKFWNDEFNKVLMKCKAGYEECKVK